MLRSGWKIEIAIRWDRGRSCSISQIQRVERHAFCCDILHTSALNAQCSPLTLKKQTQTNLMASLKQSIYSRTERVTGIVGLFVVVVRDSKYVIISEQSVVEIRHGLELRGIPVRLFVSTMTISAHPSFQDIV